MINILIVSNNSNLFIGLINTISPSNTNIRICGIAQNSEEAVYMINSVNYTIDIILLDIAINLDNHKEIMEQTRNKNKYEKSFIIMADEIDSIKNSVNNNMIYSIIPKTISHKAIIPIINELANSKSIVIDNYCISKKILNELLYLGYNVSYCGTQYLLETIEYILKDPNKSVKNLQKNVYPIIAKKYQSSINSIKVSIIRANSTMYYECEVEKLKKYFGFSKDIKPKVKTIINTIISKVS